MDKNFPGWDDSGDDDFDVVFPQRIKGSSKRKHKSKSKLKSKSRLFDIDVPYSGYDGIDDDYTEDYEPISKQIWFYPDYHFKEDRLEFNTLSSFKEYCEDMGYFIDNSVIDELNYRYESHCCLNPDSKRLGLLEILSEHSYGEMFYMVCDVSELDDVNYDEQE